MDVQNSSNDELGKTSSLHLNQFASIPQVNEALIFRAISRGKIVAWQYQFAPGAFSKLYAATTDIIHGHAVCNGLPSIKQTFYSNTFNLNPVAFKTALLCNN